MEASFEHYHPDMEAFHQQIKTDPCFVCQIVAGTNDLPQHFVYQDDRAVAFLDAYPRAYGYTLVAPEEHPEQVTGDFPMEQYLDLQQLVYRVSNEPATLTVTVERSAVGQLGRATSHVT